MSPPSVGPSRAAKVVVSLLVTVQFFVIFTVITSAGNPNFPPSPAAVQLFTVTRPYAQTFFLHNPYRFYAPEPGATNLLWARFRYEDGQTRWMELPRVQDYATRIPYQRHIALMLMLGMEAQQVAVSSDGQEGAAALADPAATVRWKYSPVGRICVQSFVRHLAHQPEYGRAYGTGAPLADVEMYHVLHNIMQPVDAKLGRRYDDPRLYTITYVGTYMPDGKPRAGESQYVKGVAYDEVFAIRIVERDLLDQLDRMKADINSDAALADALERFGMPLPFRWPILDPAVGNKNLLISQGRDQLRQLMAQVLVNSEDAAARARLSQELQLKQGGLVSPPVLPGTGRAHPANTGPQPVPGRSAR